MTELERLEHLKKVEQVVKEWIRAEYEFRLGPRAYQADAQEQITKAELRLRRIATGKGDLSQAYKIIDPRGTSSAKDEAE